MLRRVANRVLSRRWRGEVCDEHAAPIAEGCIKVGDRTTEARPVDPVEDCNDEDEVLFADELPDVGAMACDARAVMVDFRKSNPSEVNGPLRDIDVRDAPRREKALQAGRFAPSGTADDDGAPTAWKFSSGTFEEQLKGRMFGRWFALQGFIPGEVVISSAVGEIVLLGLVPARPCWVRGAHVVGGHFSRGGRAKF